MLLGQEHEHVDPEKVAEIEQMVSQTVSDANLAKQFQRETWYQNMLRIKSS